MREKGSYLDISGKRYGNFTVIKYMYTKNRKTYWLCKCKCGTEKIVASGNLKSGDTKSCGCSRIKHNKCNSRIYRIWKNMKNRCNSRACPNYNRYGGRGIKVCEEWEIDFNSFYEWALLNGYKENLTLERTNNDKGYNPDNCKWATLSEQAENKSTNHSVLYKNETHSLGMWSRILGINQNTLRHRYRAGDRGERLFRTVEKKFNGNDKKYQSEV